MHYLAKINMKLKLALFKKIGEPVVKGEPLYRIHSCFQSDFEFASAMAAENCGVAIGAVPDEEGRDQ